MSTSGKRARVLLTLLLLLGPAAAVRSSEPEPLPPPSALTPPPPVPHLLPLPALPPWLPKYDLDQEAETLQKIYRTSVKPIEGLGDGGFYLPGRREVWFRKGKSISRVAMTGFSGDAKAAEAKNSSAARLVESRIK